MILPKGITGFQVLQHPKEVKLTYLLPKLYQHYKVYVKNPHPTANYYQLNIEDKFNNFIVLINSIYPFYCGVTNSEWMQLEFIDLPKNIIAIFGKGFQYLSSSKLNKKPSKEQLQELHKSEIQQINYWKSTSIGAIIFNGYD